MIGTYWDEPPALPTKRSAMPAHQVNFVDFHESFSPKSNSLLNSLLPYFDLKLSDKPDFLFYSVFGFNHTDPRFNRCIKIWCTEENFRPDFTRCETRPSTTCGFVPRSFAASKPLGGSKPAFR